MASQGSEAAKMLGMADTEQRTTRWISTIDHVQKNLLDMDKAEDAVHAKHLGEIKDDFLLKTKSGR